MEDLDHICNNSPWAVDGAMFVLEKWRPNLVLERLQLNFIAVWVQLHGLPIEYQYPELAEKMGMLMGIVERVDWEDRIPRNIRFMRVRVQVNPWMPVITGFTLKLDDGSKTCIQCKYERVHKLCNRCGLIGHTRSQCTQSMEDVEMMLFRQRYRIQNLHQLRIVKKRIHKEIGRLGRNIRRKLLCGFYSRVSTTGDCEEDLEHAKLEIERNKAENVVQESLDAIHTEN
ncbi:uncharacterized protein At4g02000-like [Quercus lobata]|uniref:uncharacterized protein At4g02000-like n=1 Tax=Quercus lobata TaxID=97700 RepID=UPI001245389B|nr:uncharacterized protein At4g02000-like [Quercus lobata]